MSAALTALRKRLGKVQQQLDNIARRRELAKCNCLKVSVMIVGHLEEFEAMMNIACPAHGLRRLGCVVRLGHSDPIDEPAHIQEDIRREEEEMERLWNRYAARIIEDEMRKLKLNDGDDEEF